MKSKKLFLSFLPLWIFVLLFKLASATHYAILPVFGEQILPIWLVGLNLSAATFIQLPFDLLSGIILNRLGHLRTLVFSCVAFAVSAAVFVFGLNITTFLLSVVFATFAWLFFTPALNTYILDHATKANTEKLITWRDISQSSGVFIGSSTLLLFMGLSADKFGVLLSALFVAAGLFALVSPKDTEKVQEQMRESREKKTEYFKNVFQEFKKLSPASWILFLQGITSATFYAVVWFVIPLEMANHLSSLPSISLGIFDMAVVILGLSFGLIAKKTNRKRLIVFGLLLFSIMASLIGFQSGILFLVFGFLATVGDELSNITLWSWLTHMDKDHKEDGGIAGAITFSQDFGWAIGPLLAGFMYKPLGPQLTIMILALPLFFTFVFAMLKTHMIPNLDLFTHNKRIHRLRHHKH